MNQSTKPIRTSIGGQALIEGIMMNGPFKTVAAVRKPDGTIEQKELPKPTITRSKVMKIPLLRGIFSFVSSMKLGYGALMYSAEVSGEELDEPEGKLDQWLERHFGDNIVRVAAGIGMVLGVALAVVLFMWLPAFLYNLLLSSLAHGTIWRSVFEGVFRLLILLGYMLAVSQLKDIRRVFSYHGAEHKTIFCYEHGLELTVENVRPFRRFHPRCGTSFLVLMLLIGIVIGMFIRTPNPLLRTVIRLLLLPVTMGIGYELIKFCGRHDNLLTRIIAAPGMWVQRITTKEPDDSMIEVAIAALQAVIPENGEDRICTKEGCQP